MIVVGAGISGALLAETLTRAGKRVLILDRRAPVRGSTPASTAMIQHEIDVLLIDLQAERGRAEGDAAWQPIGPRGERTAGSGGGSGARLPNDAQACAVSVRRPDARGRSTASRPRPNSFMSFRLSDAKIAGSPAPGI
ncbi:FAD-dependent oxidoreductase [Fodinicurvata fenggangensis]|uniref:FAD-dependent oxidoreductase n=1 Tax=Fodinicurvata fenggangensis TaxID=1121830 RepID=UPI00068EB41C